ncbi:MAG: 16S rRNA (cytosine(1402)-N(4))-methyltransferase RsmH [Planctomycetes bacterium]|nr:16S rRNA (cytosine(1402)-N(4))-methyltransferase RsmH [Planctomycetota bacterium]
MNADSSDHGSGSAPRRRRPRYSGTHPRRFDERYKERDLEKYPDIEAHVRAQGRTPAGTHVPIMVEEVVAALRPAPGETVADLTLGYGGHALAFLTHTAPNGILIGTDLDGTQLQETGRRLEQAVDPQRLQLHNSHFAGLPKIMAAQGLVCVDIVFADLGLSSMQIDNPARGFSYKHDGPLDMRMDLRRPITAAEVIRTISPDALATALDDFADEPEHRQIALAIVRRRSEQAITQTGDLVDVVLKAKGWTRRTWRDAVAEGASELHPAARTFQALRILVNDELHGLEQLLRVAPYCLRPGGGRLGILTFHSGEDRRVKDALSEGLRSGVYVRVSEEPIRPGPTERRENPRSTAAKFRWAVRSAQ